MNSEYVGVLRQMWRQCANDRRMLEADALDGAIVALSAQQPGPAVPAGVRDLPGKWRAEVEAAEPGVKKSRLLYYWLAHLHLAEELEEALAQEPTAEEIAIPLHGDRGSLQAMYNPQVGEEDRHDEVTVLRGLLDEVRSHFTRDDDLPDDLLPRIDAALDSPQRRLRLDGAMVERALQAWFETDDWVALLSGIEPATSSRSRMRAALTAALAAQQGGRS